MGRSSTFLGPVKTSRFAAAIVSIGISLATPAGALAAGSTSTSSQITPTAPSRLTTTATTTTENTTTAATGTTPQRGTLPNTGYDLLPETLLGVLLVGAGVGLRLRRSRT